MGEEGIISVLLMKSLNENQERRDEILEPFFEGKTGGELCYFEHVPVEVLRQLFQEGFVDPEDAQNDAPSAGDFLAILESNPRFLVHGYVVNLPRSDYRISIEGAEMIEPPTEDEIMNFVYYFRCADDFELEPLPWCWYD